MLYQTIQFSASAQSITINAVGEGFWYESGAFSPDARILVTANGGDNVVLRPGQSIRFENPAQSWTITPLTAGAVGTGNIIIGSGEFQDNNTTVASIAGSVAVSNLPATQNVAITSAVELEVKNDSGNPLSVVLAGAGEVEVKNDSGNPLTVQDQLIAINKSFASTASLTAGAVSTVITPAENVNGAIIQYAYFSESAANMAILAKNSTPASQTDGTVLYWYTAGSGAKELTQKMRVPAGLGIYLIPSANTTNTVMKIVNVSTL